MDNNTKEYSYEDVLEGLKNRAQLLKIKCSIEEGKLEKKIEEISLLDREIGQMELEITDHKSRINKIHELWMEGEIEIEKLKWMQEKAVVISECNRMKNAQQSKTMAIIKQNHSNLTTCAFKTVQQETARMMINNEINNLVDRKKELGNNLRRLQKTNNENEINLSRASKELMEIKARSEAVFRLENKLQESEASRLKAIVKLNELKSSEFMDRENSQLSHACLKVGY